MAVALGIHCLWPSTVALIPSGWTRNTALDAKQPRGSAAGVDPGGTGGASTHSHTSTHTHTGTSHSHNAWAASNSVAGSSAFSGAAGAVTVNNTASGHTHTLSVTSGTTQETTAAAAGAVTDAQAHSAATLTHLFIQSNGAPAGLPAYGVAYWNSSTLPSGWLQHAASKGAYPLGAAAAADAGAIGGGASHLHASVAHTHTQSHTHTLAGSSDAGPATSVALTAGAVAASLTSHTHPLASPTGTPAASGNATAATASSTANDPPYYTLVGIQNVSGAAALPLNTICLWTGLLVNIPAGWVLCDGSNSTPDLRGKFVKHAAAVTDVSSTGGASTHTHTVPTTHTHALDHTHSYTLNTDTGANIASASGIILATHVHNGASSTLADTSSAVTEDVVAANHLPPYYDVAYIQWQFTGSINVTTPAAAGTVATPYFAAAWTLSGGRTQATYRAVIYASNGTTIVYDSSTVASATQGATVPGAPSGPPYDTSTGLVNGTSYKFQITATDTNGAQSQSALVSFTASWTSPTTPSGLAASPVGGS